MFLRIQIILIFLFPFGSSLIHGASHSTHFRYEPAVVELRGRLETRVYPGPPNYESVKKGDIAETIWLAQLPTPIKVLDDGKDPTSFNETEGNIKEVQLVIYQRKNEQTLEPLVGKTFRFTGTLFHAHTGHHHLKILMEVMRFQVEK